MDRRPAAQITGHGIGLGSGVGGGLGLLAAVLFGFDGPPGLVAGAAIGVLVGILAEAASVHGPDR